MTREEAQAAVAAVCEYLRGRETAPPGDAEPRDDWSGEPRHHRDAATWASDLLDASARDDGGGCPLCRS
jgi:hypothetical protein